MKTTTKTVTELIATEESPLPLEVIPNNMGINLCSVDALTWTRQDDGQLVSLTIHFLPAPNAPRQPRRDSGVGLDAVVGHLNQQPKGGDEHGKEQSS